MNEKAKPQPDRELVQGVRQGDLEAFAALVKRYRDAYTRFAVRMTGSLLDADDVMQSVWMRAFRNIGACKNPDRFGAWLYQIVVNECRTFTSRRALRENRFVDDPAETLAALAVAEPDVALRDEIEKALARRVDLKSGGYLVFDQTEALTTVDVNTGGFVGVRSFDDTIFKTNLEAAQVIARQLRLRNIGGMIIVDFIDMETEEHRNAVLSEFRKALARDRTHMSVNGFTQLGLVEMTRKRTRESLAQVLSEPCPVCDGRARLKTAQTVCYSILRELIREARQFNAREFRILASQPVIDLFLDEESQSLAMLSDFIAKPVSLQVETAYNQEQYDIILM